MLDFRVIMQALASIVMFAVIGAVAWWGYTAWTAHQRQAEAHADVEAAGKSIASGQAAGHDAANAVQDEAAIEAQSRALTESNRDAIEHAKGADAPVDAAATGAGLHALCLRHAYRNDPACRELRKLSPE